ncbi:DUF4178 domain-containing protein [Actinoallomurus sp. NPDC050550]|uniref:DUF4178 domain-containing protein n=1 Tax=Actinoallomurus sp. NPDC050550 TaxID=3154937 RepID=UPI0033DE91F2
MNTAVVVLLALILLALIAVIVVLIIVVGRRGGDARPAPVPVPRDPFGQEDQPGGDPRSLKAGDMVDYLGARYFVRGSIRLREGGFTWSEHLLDGDGAAGVKVWLSVEEDPDLEVVWWTGRDAGLRPDGRSLTLDGVEYRRDEHGTAAYTTEGTTGLGASGRVEYVDFEGPGGRYLSFERWDGGAWEMSTGESAPAGALTIYPGG